MAFRIGSSQSQTTLFAQRQLTIHRARSERALERLSSGRRLNRAADGPAELAISERMKARVRSVIQARRNTFDGLSTAQIGDGALNETSNLLIRVRELAVQSANGGLSTSQRRAIGEEATALLDEVDRVASVTRFAGKRLLDGGDAIEITTGADATASLSLPSVDATKTALGLDGIDLGTDAASAASAFARIDAAISEVTAARGEFGTASNILESRIRQSLTEEEAVRAAESRIADADIAEEASELAAAQILEQASIAVLAQATDQDKLILELLEPLD